MRSAPKAPRYAANVEAIPVVRADSGKPLQDFLAARFGLSRRAAKAVIDGRNVWVNRRSVWIAHHPLKLGDLVEVPRAVVSAAKRQCSRLVARDSRTANGDAANCDPRATNHEPRTASREVRHVRLLVETKDYVVADKPAGLLTNEDARSVETILRAQLDEPNLQAVHRLDRDTSGCLLLARNYAAFLAAVEVFKTRKVLKVYHAVAVGKMEHPHETVDAPLDGKPAVSHVSREVAGPDASFLKVRIETGRTNQIRRHLASIRHPVAGDRTFGLKTARDPRFMSLPRAMLHASQLTLPNPTERGQEIRAKSPLPADFRAALRLFGMGRR